MGQAAHVHHPHGPDLYNPPVPVTAGPHTANYPQYLATTYAKEAGRVSVIRGLNNGTMTAPDYPSLAVTQKAAVGDWLVPLDVDHNGSVEDIALVRHGQDWRTIYDINHNYTNGFNWSLVFEGHRIRWVWQSNGGTPLLMNINNGESFEACFNRSKHDGTGDYGHATVATGTGNFIQVFGGQGGAVLRGEAIKRTDGRWVSLFRGFINFTPDDSVVNMGGDYYQACGRMVWTAGAVVGFGAGSYAGQTGNVRVLVEALG